jgi:signal transduction histidine kinase
MTDPQQPPAATGPTALDPMLVEAHKMATIGRLAPGVAHDLNNPLAAIVAFSQLIERDERLPEDLRRDADLLVEAADRTRRLVQVLLDFARDRPPERHPTALEPLVGSVLELLSYPIAAARVTVDVDIPADVPAVALDRVRMQQVLLTLTLDAIDAVRAGGGGGRLTIRAATVRDDGEERDDSSGGTAGGARNAEDRVRLEVAGDAVEAVGHAEPDGGGWRTTAAVAAERMGPARGSGGEGTRGGDGTPGGAGTLGRAVASAIVGDHAGRLTFTPTAGGGTRFTIDLPIEAADPPERPPPGRPDPEARQPRG